MKNLILFAVLLPIFAVAQINIDNTWKSKINAAFENLDKSKIKSGMLLDYAMEFTDVTTYNGLLQDNNYINPQVLGDIYKTLFFNKVKCSRNFLNEDICYISIFK